MHYWIAQLEYILLDTNIMFLALIGSILALLCQNSTCLCDILIVYLPGLRIYIAAPWNSPVRVDTSRHQNRIYLTITDPMPQVEGAWISQHTLGCPRSSELIVWYNLLWISCNVISPLFYYHVRERLYQNTLVIVLFFRNI